MSSSRKANYGGLAGALSVVLVWLVHSVYEVKIPPEVASAITTILGVLIYIVTPEKK